MSTSEKRECVIHPVTPTVNTDVANSFGCPLYFDPRLILEMYWHTFRFISRQINDYFQFPLLFASLTFPPLPFLYSFLFLEGWLNCIFIFNLPKTKDLFFLSENNFIFQIIVLPLLLHFLFCLASPISPSGVSAKWYVLTLCSYALIFLKESSGCLERFNSLSCPFQLHFNTILHFYVVPLFDVDYHIIV